MAGALLYWKVDVAASGGMQYQFEAKLGTGRGVVLAKGWLEVESSSAMC